MPELKSLCDFQAGIANVKTMADGSPRITLDCPEEEVKILSLLAQFKIEGRYLRIVIYSEEEFMKEVGKR